MSTNTSRVRDPGHLRSPSRQPPCPNLSPTGRGRNVRVKGALSGFASFTSPGCGAARNGASLIRDLRDLRDPGSAAHQQ